jgi:ligand-binding sensor domain-containing protein
MKMNKTSARKLLLAIAMTGLYFYGQTAFASDGLFVTEPSQPGISAKKFYAITVDNNDKKWFLTESGIVSFDGTKWELQSNNALQGKEINDITFDTTTEGTGFWIATGAGLTSLKSLTDNSQAVSFTTDNAILGSNDTRKVAVGSNNVKWVGTDKGVAAYSGGKWLKLEYDDLYPEMLFETYPISAIAPSLGGDTLYVATKGIGVSRVFLNDVDGISGASEYAIWGPIIMPSDNIQSLHIDKDGTQWLGTDLGIAKHTGGNTLDNWTIYDTSNGLVNNFVQAITSDQNGNMWFGTPSGISVFDGSKFTNYTTANGLNSNNILCIAVDKKGIVWIGTDAGVNSFSNDTFNSFK